jgi:hypothetical protein
LASQVSTLNPFILFNTVLIFSISSFDAEYVSLQFVQTFLINLCAAQILIVEASKKGSTPISINLGIAVAALFV